MMNCNVFQTLFKVVSMPYLAMELIVHRMLQDKHSFVEVCTGMTLFPQFKECVLRHPALSKAFVHMRKIYTVWSTDLRREKNKRDADREVTRYMFHNVVLPGQSGHVSAFDVYAKERLERELSEENIRQENERSDALYTSAHHPVVEIFDNVPLLQRHGKKGRSGGLRKARHHKQENDKGRPCPDVISARVVSKAEKQKALEQTKARKNADMLIRKKKRAEKLSQRMVWCNADEDS
jgi:hypothetical protein